MRAKVWETLKITWQIFSRIEAEERAAAFAYYAFFALFPLLALILTAGTLFVAPTDVIHLLEKIAPIAADQQGFIWQTVATLEKERGSITLISLAILTWTSMRFFHALVRGVNQAWDLQPIPWWQMPLKNLMMVATITSALLIGILAPAVLQGIAAAALAFDAFLKTFIPEFDLHGLLSLLAPLRYGIGTVVLFYAFTILYMLAPRRRIPFQKVWLVTLLVTLLLQLSQVAFVNYLPHLIRYNTIYGAISSLMFLLMWIYVSGMILMAGGCLIVAIEKVWRQPGDKPPLNPESPDVA